MLGGSLCRRYHDPLPPFPGLGGCCVRALHPGFDAMRARAAPVAFYLGSHLDTLASLFIEQGILPFAGDIDGTGFAKYISEMTMIFHEGSADYR